MILAYFLSFFFHFAALFPVCPFFLFPLLCSHKAERGASVGFGALNSAHASASGGGGSRSWEADEKSSSPFSPSSAVTSACRPPPSNALRCLWVDPLVLTAGPNAHAIQLFKKKTKKKNSPHCRIQLHELIPPWCFCFVRKMQTGPRLI